MEDFVNLYRQAFTEYKTRALRIEGNLEARKLAEQIEQACRAALGQ